MGKNTTYTATVLRGDQYGRTLGFPTANLDPNVLTHVETEGVYACVVHLGSHAYRGALYLGPRIVLDETKRVLEIHILNFDQEIYGQRLSFELGRFVRPPMDFPNITALQSQFLADIAAVETARPNI